MWQQILDILKKVCDSDISERNGGIVNDNKFERTDIITREERQELIRVKDVLIKLFSRRLNDRWSIYPRAMFNQHYYLKPNKTQWDYVKEYIESISKDTDVNEYTALTQKYLETSDTEHRRSLAQFFTPKPILQETMRLIAKNNQKGF